MAFAKWIEAQRQKQGLSVTECARRAKIDQSVWSDYEGNGEDWNPREKTIKNIADALGVSHSAAMIAAGRQNPAPKTILEIFMQAISGEIEDMSVEQAQKMAPHLATNLRTLKQVAA